MKVLLTQFVEGVGQRGEEKEVTSGYARNFLFPRGLATILSDPRAKELKAERRAMVSTRDSQKRVVSELAATWKGQTYTTKARASEDGSLYGSVGPKEIRKLLGRDDIDFDCPTLKQLGRHTIELAFADGIKVPITVIIEAESTK